MAKAAATAGNPNRERERGWHRCQGRNSETRQRGQDFRSGCSVAHVKKSVLRRASCGGVEIRLCVEPDVAWLTIKRSGEERQYRDIAQGEVAQVVEQFEAIGEDPEKFKAFLSRAA